MAQNIKINGVTYNGVSSLSIPKSGSSGDAVFTDTSGATMTAADLLSGVKGYGANGTLITGSLTTKTVRSGSGEPDNSVGADGDFYIVLEA